MSRIEHVVRLFHANCGGIVVGRPPELKCAECGKDMELMVTENEAALIDSVTKVPKRASQIIPLAGVSKHGTTSGRGLPVLRRVSRHCHLDLCLDGNAWSVLFGSDIQSGVAGFGMTADEALDDFEMAFQLRENPMSGYTCLANAGHGQVYGDGATPDEAIRALLTAIEEAQP